MANIKVRVYKIVSQVPPGRVMTYGQIGKILGIHPRQVGRILHLNVEPETIPCHRVVNSLGRVAINYAFGGGKIQQQKLEQEGIIFNKNRVDLKKYRWEDMKVGKLISR